MWLFSTDPVTFELLRCWVEPDPPPIDPEVEREDPNIDYAEADE